VGEPVGFREFVAARSPALLRTAWLLTGDAHLAEDLLQTALARTWPQWARLHPTGDPDAYVRRVMVNTSLSWRARPWNGEWATDQLPVREATDPHGRVLDRAYLADVLCALTPRQRAVLVLRFFEDLSEQQTADLLGCSVGTVKSHTSRALATLRAEARVLSSDPQLSPEGRLWCRSGRKAMCVRGCELWCLTWLCRQIAFTGSARWQRRHGNPVAGRRERASPGRVVGAGRTVGEVEIGAHRGPRAHPPGEAPARRG